MILWKHLLYSWLSSARGTRKLEALFPFLANQHAYCVVGRIPNCYNGPAFIILTNIE